MGEEKGGGGRVGSCFEQGQMDWAGWFEGFKDRGRKSGATRLVRIGERQAVADVGQRGELRGVPWKS